MPGTLDDRTTVGSSGDLAAALSIIERVGHSVGFHLNRGKSVLFIPSKSDPSRFPCYQTLLSSIRVSVFLATPLVSLPFVRRCCGTGLQRWRFLWGQCMIRVMPNWRLLSFARVLLSPSFPISSAPVPPVTSVRQPRTLTLQCGSSWNPYWVLKRYTRAHCDYTFPGLERTIVPALESVRLNTIKKHFRKCRGYMQAYREGNSGGKDMEKAVKLYKSHRRVFGSVD